MVERVSMDLRGLRGFAGAVFRYDLVDRVRRTCAAHEVAFLAFGFGPDGELRLVLDGDEVGIRESLRGVKVGTRRAVLRLRPDPGPGPHRRTPCEATDGVSWAHGAVPDPRGPLATPWTSHRDLLGFRYAPFFDPRPACGRVDPLVIHARLGGDRLPDGWPPPARAAHQVSSLLRIAAAVLGVLPADRRCFRTFAHLARAYGVTTVETARALAVTDRRVRQLRAEPEPLLALALTTAADPALCRVP